MHFEKTLFALVVNRDEHQVKTCAGGFFAQVIIGLNSLGFSSISNL
jgi:hypothetical protein